MYTCVYIHTYINMYVHVHGERNSCRNMWNFIKSALNHLSQSSLAVPASSSTFAHTVLSPVASSSSSLLWNIAHPPSLGNHLCTSHYLHYYLAYDCQYVLSSQLKWSSSSPGRCGSVGWSVFHKEKGLQFDSQSGHMPGLQIQSPVRARARDTQSMFLSHIDVFLSPSLPSPLSKNR